MLTLEQKTPRRIIVVGQTFEESRTVQRVKAMRSLGCSVRCVRTAPAGVNYETPPDLMQRIRYRLRLPGDPAKTNGTIIGEVERGADILWLEAADMVRPSTLRRARRISENLALVWYSEDDMMNPRIRTRYLEGALPLFDLAVTTKSFNARPEELPSLGARRVLFVNNSCDPLLHRPIDVSEEERKRFGAPVSFIGSFEQPRGQSVLHLARHGLNVRVWGNGWADWVGRHPNLTVENKPAYNDDFAMVVSASPINLCFLRRSNRDLQTCRSMEIPACSGFMIHERNDEITTLYREGKEAVYFSSDDELAAVCSLWLSRGKQRRAVGAAARERTFERELIHGSNVIRILNALPSKPLDGAQ
jgi:hypothetical protein